MLKHFISSTTGEYIKSENLSVNMGFTTSQPLPEIELAENEYFAMLDSNGKVQYWPDNTGCTWQVKARFEKVTAYNKETQKPKQFDDKTLVPNEYTPKPPPTRYHTWSIEQDNWELTPEQAILQFNDSIELSFDNIDSLAAEVTSNWSRFAEEYEITEAQAEQFKQTGYQGECGSYVTSYAVPKGISNQEATDIILAQAQALRDLQSELRVQRMRKYELLSCSTIGDVEALSQEIQTNIKTLGESYA